jgi:hypothetical protein
MVVVFPAPFAPVQEQFAVKIYPHPPTPLLPCRRHLIDSSQELLLCSSPPFPAPLYTCSTHYSTYNQHTHIPLIDRSIEADVVCAFMAASGNAKVLNNHLITFKYHPSELKVQHKR